MLVGHTAEREFADEVLHSGELTKLGDLLQALAWGADDLNGDVEVVRLLAEGGVFHFRIGLGHLSVSLVTLHVAELPIGELVVALDGIPLRPQVPEREIFGFRTARGARDVR